MTIMHNFESFAKYLKNLNWVEKNYIEIYYFHVRATLQHHVFTPMYARRTKLKNVNNNNNHLN